MIAIRRLHENSVPIPQGLEGKRPLLRQRRMDGAGVEVAGDPRGRATDRRVNIGDGDKLGGSVDRLDPTGRHSFGAQQEPGELETRIVLDGRQAQHPLRPGGISLGGGAKRATLGHRGTDGGADGATLPVDGDDLVRHREPFQMRDD